MSLITASQVGQSFGAVDLFQGINVTVPPGAKIGLVGPNGIGKTTLLLILAGLATPSRGVVKRARRCRVGYLAQESADAFVGQDHTVIEEMLTVFDDLRDQEAALREMEREMAGGAANEDLLAAYGRALEAFEHAGGYDYELRIRQTLTGLGFDGAGMRLPLPHLSGGQKTRALLARLLLSGPDLLVLDEPTNHLDIAALEWLEGALRAWPGAVLIVSHDRYFLDRVVDRIWEMNTGGVEEYRGNYSHYVAQRQARWERRQKEFTAFKERAEKELDFIRRNMAGQLTAQAQGRLKRLARELKAVQAGGLAALQGRNWARVAEELDLSSGEWSIGDAGAALNALRPPHGRPPRLNLRLAEPDRSGELVLRTRDLTVGYPGHLLFKTDDIELRRLEVAALIGPNGAGKTTFLRTILGHLPPLDGELLPGASLDIGYFAQAHEELDPGDTVLEALLREHPMLPGEARHILGRYLFRGDDVDKRVDVLSGGERGRLALAILAERGANFLLLDEPTNHLDIPAQEVLQEVLEAFNGTILLVSHDRYLIDRLATQIWELADRRLRVFAGSYQEYLVAKAATANPVGETTPAPADDAVMAGENGSLRSKNAQRRLETSLQDLEGRIAGAERRLETVVAALQSATEDQDFDRIQSLSLEYGVLQNEVEQLMLAWEDLANER